jgi:peptidoglycan hydrolase-like protein with peptidoglycan-binding domain
MKNLRHLTATSALLLTLVAAAPAWAQGMRPEVGRPLQQAGELLRAGKAKEALAKAREADAVANKTSAEQLTVDRMKAASAQRAGESGAAIQALESIYSRVGGGEQGQIAEQLASAFAQQRNNAKANEWVAKAVAAGNTGPSVKQLQSYLQSNSGDYAAIGREAGAAVAAAEQAGRRPDEGELLRLADAQQRLGNTSGQVETLEKLALAHPKKEYWTAFLSRLPRKAGFSDRLSLDVLRLRLATGNLGRTEDFMELAQLLLQAGVPSEALRVIDQGTKAGLMGAGPEAARHQRLRELAVKQEGELKASLPNQTTEAVAAKDGEGLVRVGYSLVSMGDTDKGIELIRQGISKGNLKRPADAQLRLGMSQLQSAKFKSVAAQTLRSIKSSDGVAEIARTWAVVGMN